MTKQTLTLVLTLENSLFIICSRRRQLVPIVYTDISEENRGDSPITETISEHLCAKTTRPIALARVEDENGQREQLGLDRTGLNQNK